MTTISHKNLTGLQLHENKGVDSATADQVATANGTGSTVWKKLTSANLAATANPFGAALLHVRDRFASGGGGSPTVMTAATWTTIRFQTVQTTEITSASLASNQISLPSGTYYIQADINLVPTYNTSYLSVVARLRNITAGTTLLTSPIRPNFVSQNGYPINAYWPTICPLYGRFTLSGTSALEIQAYSTTTGTYPGQYPSTVPTTGEDNVFQEALIWKIA